MATLAAMKSRIALELSRDDLTSEIASAISDAISFHEAERFWFNQTRTITFNTVASQVAYTSLDNAYIPDLVRIDRLYFTDNSQIYDLDRYEPQDFEFISNNTASSGKPTCFTYTDSEIRLWPTPNAAFVMRIYGHYKLTALTDDSQSNAWTTEAEELIRTAAKLRLYLDVMKNEQGAARMQAKMDPLLDRLRAETSSRLSTGIIRPTEF